MQDHSPEQMTGRQRPRRPLLTPGPKLARRPAGPQARAALLRGLADALEAERQTLVPLADAETSLGAARLNGELDRTSFQPCGFVDQVLAGAPFAMTDDAAVAGP